MKCIFSLVFVLVTHYQFSQFNYTSACKPPVRKVISNSVSIQKFDVFNQFLFSLQTKQVNFTTGLGFGLNRSFYQNQLFPELGISLSTNLYSLKREQKSPVFFGPEVRITHSFLQLVDLHHFTSLFVGYYFQIGSKWSFIHRAGLGGLRESFRSTFTKNIGASTFAYYGSIGIGYAWN